MGHWVTKDGAMILYFINHRKSGDTVESFRYDPSKKSLVHRRTFRSKQFFNLNDLVLVGLDQFYVTVDHYFSNKAMFQLETYLRVPMAYVLYHDGEESFVASEGLKYPNGIAKSNDGRYSELPLIRTPEMRPPLYAGHLKSPQCTLHNINPPLK